MTAETVKSNALRANRDGSIAGPVDAQDTSDEFHAAPNRSGMASTRGRVFLPVAAQLSWRHPVGHTM